jgi:hypothetical protein
LRDAKGESIVPARLIVWGVSNETVATVEWFDGGGPWSALLTFVGEGSTTITASLDGFTAGGELTAISDPPLSDALVIESFSMIEFAYADPSGPYWHYAPQVVLADQTGSGVDVIGVQFSIADWGDASYCAATRSVDSGASLELFREVHGDYELSFSKQGVRAGSGEATAAIYFVARDGTPGKALAVGPVTPGGFPTTYTGGVISDLWNCTFPYVPQ